MMYECYNKYGQYIGVAYTKSEAKQIIDYANYRATKVVYSEWLDIKKYDPNISFAEYELQYINKVKAKTKEDDIRRGKTVIKWIIIVTILFLIYVYLNDPHLFNNH